MQELFKLTWCAWEEIFSQKNDSIKRYTYNQSLLQNTGCCKWGSTDGRADSDTFSQVYNQLSNAKKLIVSHMHKWTLLLVPCMHINSFSFSAKVFMLHAICRAIYFWHCIPFQ